MYLKFFCKLFQIPQYLVNFLRFLSWQTKDCSLIFAARFHIYFVYNHVWSVCRNLQIQTAIEFYINFIYIRSEVSLISVSLLIVSDTTSKLF